MDNPRLSPIVWVATVIVFVVVLGGSLFLFAPQILVPSWPWRVPPFNARFLGAIYLAEAVAVVGLLVQNRWSPGRLVIIMAVAFTSAATLGSIIHAADFIYASRRTLLWFFLYGIYVVLPAAALWYYRRLPVPIRLPLPPARRVLALTVGSAMIAYGLAMFAAPELATGFWPWPIDGLHGRIYSGVFLSAGIGIAVAARHAGRAEVQAVGIAAATLGVAAIAGLFAAAIETGKLESLGVGAIVWLAIFAVIAGTGAELFRLGRSR